MTSTFTLVEYGRKPGIIPIAAFLTIPNHTLNNIQMSTKQTVVPEGFSTDLRDHRWNCIRLYRAIGNGGSATIDIVKETWVDIDGAQPEPFKGGQYPVFYVYNYVDPSKMFRPGWSGCCVHDHKKPFTNLADALAVAENHAAMAIESKQWVHFEDLNPPKRARLTRLNATSEQLGLSAVVIF